MTRRAKRWWTAAAQSQQVDLVTPRVGEIVVARQPFASQPWWEAVR